jgi:hypothetical protein
MKTLIIILLPVDIGAELWCLRLQSILVLAASFASDSSLVLQAI